MATWCTYCDAKATHMVEQTEEPLCGTCSTAYKTGQLSPDTSVVPIPEFEVVEHAEQVRVLTYRFKAVSPRSAEQMVEEGVVGWIDNKPDPDRTGFKTVAIKGVRRL
jgi:hypothetical protein